MLIDQMKENCFTLKKKKKNPKSRRYPAETLTDADFVDDLALLGNTSAQAESLLHSLKQVASGIGFHKNSAKTFHMF